MENVIVDEALFETYLECETQFYFKAAGKVGTDTEFTNYKNELYRKYKEEGQQRLCDSFLPDECFVGTPSVSEFKRKQYALIINAVLQKDRIGSHVHALERIGFRGSKKVTQYIPIRFVPNEKVTKVDKLLLAFDGLVVSDYLGREPLFGKIIHGNKHSKINVRLLEPLEIIRSFIYKIDPNEIYIKPPNVILNKHCAECEFQSQCQTTAIEKDDLSLLSGLSAKERDNLHKKGIFTVTQLSYTFRPRRRPKRSASKPTKYNHSLKALAIRECKTYIVGQPKLDIEGTPVYLDVEGIPDQDFYYLIGFRFKRNHNFTQEFLWANGLDEERIIWCKFLESVSQIHKPISVHYGSYETRFLKHMKERYGRGTTDSDFLENLIADSLNLLSVIHAQVYFPTYSNGLKDIAQHLGFSWSCQKASGINCLLWRYQWEHTHGVFLRNRIITYNAEDCEALNRVTECLHQLCDVSTGIEGPSKNNAVHTDSMKRHRPYCFGKNEFVTKELEYVNRCAYWDYQREKVHIRSNPRLRRILKKIPADSAKKPPTNKVIDCPRPSVCSRCGNNTFSTDAVLTKDIYDLKFSNSGVKRYVTKYRFDRCRCNKCRAVCYSPKKTWSRSNYGWNLLAYIAYLNVDLRVPQNTAIRNVNQLFNLCIPNNFHHFRATMSRYYKSTYEKLLNKIVSGKLIHVDETPFNEGGSKSYVWTLTNLEEVVYIYTKTREGDMIQNLLKKFRGVLVSDFYSAYDSIDCPQQKCLIHLIRDMNDDIFEAPFDTEYKDFVGRFGLLIKPMIETIDRYGLRKYHLKKHKKAVDQFYETLTKFNDKSAFIQKYIKRFNKYRDKLFTFLDYDDVPWNNNNAETAIKAFVAARRVFRASTRQKGMREYLILLSVCQTCRYKAANFLKFLCSGKRDIDEFLNTRRGR